MRLLGLEPKTYGLKVRRASDASCASDTTCNDEPNDLAFCLALLKQTRSDLAAVAEAWDTLPDAVRVGIVAIVKASIDRR